MLLPLPRRNIKSNLSSNRKNAFLYFRQGTLLKIKSTAINSKHHATDAKQVCLSNHIEISRCLFAFSRYRVGCLYIALPRLCIRYYRDTLPFETATLSKRCCFVRSIFGRSERSLSNEWITLFGYQTNDTISNLLWNSHRRFFVFIQFWKGAVWSITQQKKDWLLTFDDEKTFVIPLVSLRKGRRKKTIEVLSSLDKPGITRSNKGIVSISPVEPARLTR